MKNKEQSQEIPSDSDCDENSDDYEREKSDEIPSNSSFDENSSIANTDESFTDFDESVELSEDTVSEEENKK
ncbi:hypothetical protein TVAG_168680 [Trichomonas vaginalis G3]|uniref:Uncharacterized protein n=2 Tax=Trichomonas vaginalis (strain ATCC PRA-98 / G3) TaxID=412133 RepID=A2FHE5_TRIV3|nr:hypothetical protein TVAG_168680 [Trichomonas vaginalis G3]|eukprot:XP_001308592.1 hypothetical protein [Trichomonas vaginalis G3]